MSNPDSGGVERHDTQRRTRFDFTDRQLEVLVTALSEQLAGMEERINALKNLPPKDRIDTDDYDLLVEYVQLLSELKELIAGPLDG